MILDARLENVPMEWAVQVAIIGAGPAGMTLARELADVAHVMVLEGGGFENDANQQALLVGECAGMDYPLAETRARQFGGSSALWAGYCAVFDPHDFSLRDWVPRSGWPFGIETIQPYYAKTAEILNLGEPNFDARDIARRSGVVLPFDNQSFVPTVWRFGTPTKRFGECLRHEFEISSNITTLIHANVVDIRLDAEHSMVKELTIRTLDGRQGHVSADVFVLACGGIETPRLLLNADTQVSYGLGNANDMVGRCFMEHPHRCITPLIVQDLDLFESWTRRGYYDGHREFTPCVGLSKEAQEEARVMNARAHVYRTPEMRDDETPKVGLFMEQAPNSKSRVFLSNRTDSLGMRRVRLDWQLTELDWRTYERTASALAAEFERIGAGCMRAPIEPTARGDEPVLHSNHHLGTTRMSERKEDGVVDPDCRVHDLSNVYIIGGSIFPTVSWANPTFTLMALTLRLADHLHA
ncbi:MAG: GMC family oxidoreductase, partial [Terriglobales bacterium]